MLKSYIKIAWRNLLRNKIFSAINISGLALGMACSLLIILWLQDERGVDGFHANGDYLYQVYESQFYDGKVGSGYTTQGLLAEELKKVIPEVQYASGLEYTAPPGTFNTFEAGEQAGKMDGYYAGTDFLSMFSYPLLHGNPQTALNGPTDIAISRKMATFFFGTPEKAIGKSIRFENKEDLQVTAIFEDVPANASRHFDFLRTWKAFVAENDWVGNWNNTSPATFVQLRKDADRNKVAAKMKDFIYRYKTKIEGERIELGIQPYPETYLYSIFKNGAPDGGRIEYVKLFTLVSIFILLIACINFMNLTTAQSAKRAKEVGLRKVIGAGRSSLIGQFMGEAMLLTACAFIIAVLLAILLLPAFNTLTGKQLSLPVSQPLFWLSLIGLLLVTGVVAGSYPALFLSSLNPVRVLKGGLKIGGGSTWLRKGLVVFQFALSIILMISMVVIYRQMNYIQTKNLGYDREDLVYIPIEGNLMGHYAHFKEEASRLPGILSVSKMRNSPTIIEHHTGDVAWEGKDPNDITSFADGVVGYDFVKTMKLQLKAGRDFSREFGADSVAYLLNETAVKKIGYKDPIGQMVTWRGNRGPVIGVLKDFHFNSIHQTIDPLIIRLDENWSWGTILIRTKAGKTKEAIASLEKLYTALNPGFPFTYQFSDLEYTKLYKSEKVVSVLSNYFALLAIFISCLGLFGLATFTAAQRTKEIGVRKVLGASVPNITAMLSGDFLKLILIAMVLGFPAAWLFMDQWLQGFAYKIDIEWWMFMLTGVVIACIALLTVSYQSLKAALMNPVKSLKIE
ncbi:ABC transporter permease [Chitinophaga ginsengisoli]|uniref:FtsX-like permease family protein n=1 Tax=Chitinophaga ginsengisoli TaxID=363837 RepID=A0A2P8FPR5_9BACT|nr:ABC transporter permease [Chitinophaga ginsengisoli]PSL23731.1 FtsX-like permease family protein [Chitinophaga ginsengisoli]